MKDQPKMLALSAQPLVIRQRGQLRKIGFTAQFSFLFIFLTITMDGNKDEALKCLSIAQRHRDSGNFSSARKFCLKSIALFSTPEAIKLLETIEKLESSSNGKAESSGSSSNQGPSSSTFTSGTESHPSASGSKHRQTTSTASSSKVDGTASGNGGEKREYTTENAAVVKRVRACAVTQYYEILGLSKDCAEADVKKAYRKVCAAIYLFLQRNIHFLSKNKACFTTAS